VSLVSGMFTEDNDMRTHTCTWRCGGCSWR
jgi:hypothetical protein